MTATTLDSQKETLSKYPQAEAYLKALSCTEDAEQERRDVLKSAGTERKSRATGDEGQDNQDAQGAESDESFMGFSDTDGQDEVTPTVTPRDPDQTARLNQGTVEGPQLSTTPGTKARHAVFYSTDATKLSKHPLLKRRRFNKIIFNFPHVGGKSTDVNRQVRYNQEMLHAFLGEAKKMLEACRLGDTKVREARQKQRQQSDRYDTDEEAEEEVVAQGRITHDATVRLRDYVILVTIFEGEPYTLWNIKDLARSNGLECRTSWVFDWSLYPGYHHARTLGNLRHAGKSATTGEAVDALEDEDVSPGKKSRGPGWRGEDRKARTYEFSLKAEQQRRHNSGKRKKRKRGQDSSSSESN